MATPAIRTPLSQVIELLAAVPSVIYGFWGLFVFRFWIADWIEKPIASILGFIPTFQGPLLGLDVLTAGLILAIMIIPTISAISKEVMLSVPATQREAAYSLGATKWEAVRIAVLSYARSGIFGAIILGLGRAVGETMAVTMVIGNANVIPVSLFQSGQTMSSAIVSQFSEADFGTLQFSALVGVGLVLLMFAIIINIFAQVMVWKIFRIRGGSVE
jgi:phosphate transport system permease protein